ncbi:hypothetical protein SAMN04487970_104326 [Paenibacillus tianmuensis]|uniref:Uncharacterized protein n=1 Tax=Paenibacillus tianmuensis TaxID=624147 RepID=A0A1G4T609_9BACL|nr:hypothetical protein [Paenibacillus tianmuensis]SCW76731.1 hypothetical protein SAMN04487970_104326 [Paenibacillus tianmuensis]
MSRTYKVIRPHRSNYPQPIRLSAGERVILGELDGPSCLEQMLSIAFSG